MAHLLRQNLALIASTVSCGYGSAVSHLTVPLRDRGGREEPTISSTTEMSWTPVTQCVLLSEISFIAFIFLALSLEPRFLLLLLLPPPDGKLTIGLSLSNFPFS